MTKEELIKNQFPNDEFLQSSVLQIVDKCVADLEKENAELKKKNLNIQDAVTMQMYTNKANKEIADSRIAKAKEIIKKLYSHVFEGMGFMEISDYNVQKAEAEQFLNSEVEK